jgi:hypothetical protein
LQDCYAGFAKAWGEEGQDLHVVINCAHLKNMRLYAQRGPKSILTQVNKLVGEGNWKMVQMKTLFHFFTHGHPMLEYETLYELLASLGVPNNPTMHWLDFVGCILVEFMHTQVKSATLKAI